MKRASSFFQAFCSFQNLLTAARQAHRGSRRNQEATSFFFHLETELLSLREAILAGTWQPQPYRYFEITDPKQRTISVAAFRDRVVHHALVNVLEPLYERCFIADSFATRKGKGTHAAVGRAQRFLRQNRYFLKTDVEKYFDSIGHDTLLVLLARKINDRPLLTICEKIIRNGGLASRGLPIGNLTSQFFANVYLDPLDQFVKNTLQVPAYLRYMDDFVLFSPEKEDLKNWKPALEDFLQTRLGLVLKPAATFLNSRENGLSFLGTRIFPATVRLRRQNLRRITRRLAAREQAWQQGDLGEDQFLQSMNSYWALLAAYPTAPLRRSLLNSSIAMT